MTRQKGALTVTIIQAKDIPKTDMMGLGSADPYIIFSTLPEADPKQLRIASLDATNDKVQRTQVGEPNVPIWHETFKIMLDTDVAALYLHLFDEDKTGDDYLGATALPLDAQGGFEHEWIMDEWVDFKGGKATGTKLHLLVHFQPQTVLEHLGKRWNKQVSDIKNSLYKNAVQSAVKMATGVQV